MKNWPTGVPEKNIYALEVRKRSKTNEIKLIKELRNK